MPLFYWKSPLNNETFKETKGPFDLYVGPDDLDLNPGEYQTGEDDWTVELPPDEV